MKGPLTPVERLPDVMGPSGGLFTLEGRESSVAVVAGWFAVRIFMRARGSEDIRLPRHDSAIPIELASDSSNRERDGIDTRCALRPMIVWLSENGVPTEHSAMC